MVELRRQLEDEQERELECALTALRGKYERLKDEAVGRAVQSALQRVTPPAPSGFDLIVRSSPNASTPLAATIPRAASSSLQANLGVHDETHSRADNEGAVRAEEKLIRRHLALRQYIEMRRAMLGPKATSKAWRLVVRRGCVLANVLEIFGALSSRSRGKRAAAFAFRDSSIATSGLQYRVTSRSPRVLCAHHSKALLRHGRDLSQRVG